MSEGSSNAHSAADREPNRAAALYNRGGELRQLRRFDEAIAAFDGAIALQPGYAEAHNGRGIVLANLNRVADALASFENAVALKPDYAEAYNNRGMILQDLARLDEALASYDRALELNPKSPGAWLGRANALTLLRRYHEAKGACETALAIDPLSVQGLVQLGQCHAFQADVDAAIAQFEKALSIAPGHEGALGNRIFTLDFSTKADVVHHQAARADWWRAIGSKPRSIPKAKWRGAKQSAVYAMK